MNLGRFTLTAILVLGIPAALAQNTDPGAKQDMKNAGSETKHAATNAGHGISHGTETAYDKTKSGTKTGYHKKYDNRGDTPNEGTPSMRNESPQLCSCVRSPEKREYFNVAHHYPEGEDES